MRVRWAGVLLVLAGPAGAQNAVPAPSDVTPAIAVPAGPLDTPAQAAVNKLPKPRLPMSPQRFSEADKTRVEVVTRLDEILVYGQVEPEEYAGPKKAPFLQFRERLE